MSLAVAIACAVAQERPAATMDFVRERVRAGGLPENTFQALVTFETAEKIPLVKQIATRAIGPRSYPTGTKSRFPAPMIDEMLWQWTKTVTTADGRAS